MCAAFYFLCVSDKLTLRTGTVPSQIILNKGLSPNIRAQIFSRIRLFPIEYIHSLRKVIQKNAPEQ